MKKTVIIILLVVLTIVYLSAQQDWKSKFDSIFNSSMDARWTNLSRGKSGNGALDYGSKAYYFLGDGIDALTAMYEATGDVSYINTALEYIEQVIKDAKENPCTSEPCFHDNYSGWVGGAGLEEDYKAYIGKEVVLWESCMWRYVAKLLRVMKASGLANNPTYQTRFNAILSFTEVNMWDKWYHRGSSQQYIYRNRTHMRSHWGTIALNLYGLTADSSRKSECLQVYTQIDNDLKNNLQDVSPNAYFWYCTWGTLSGTVQDVSHGNHVLSYIIESYQQEGVFWKPEDIIKFKNTLKEIVWNSSTCEFADFVDGDYGPVEGADNTGRFQADGWVKLGRYFNDIYNIHQSFLGCNPNPNHGHQLAQFYANMALNEEKFSQIIENPVSASMKSPIPGTTLPGAAVTFTWDAGIAIERYALDVGSSLGAADIYDESSHTNLSRTVSNIPIDGRTIYVRLISKDISGVWSYRDYTYTALKPVSAKMKTPTPGTTLPGATVTFTWDAGVGIERYALDVGSSLGAADIYDESSHTNLSRTVGNIPTDGRTIYVRLISKDISGVWSHIDYTYQASN